MARETARGTGCHTCRTRKIKCDLAVPICQRCARARRTCVPSSSQQTLTIHSENNYVAGEKKRPRGPRSSYSKPSLELEDLALAYFLQHHLHTTTSTDEPNLGGEWSECISRYRASGKLCPTVDLALSALSLVVYARIHRFCAAADIGSRKYSELLKIMHTNIQCNSFHMFTRDACIDGALLAIFLMSRYENTVSGMNLGISHATYSPESLPIWSHHDGALAFLKTWYSDLGTAAEVGPTGIIKASRRGLIRSHIIRNLALPDWLLDGERFGEGGSDLAYDKFLVRLANFRSTVIDLEQQHTDICTARIEELDRESIALRSILLEWREKFLSANNQQHPYYRATVLGNGPWPRLHFYSPTFYIFDSLTDAAKWLNYFAVSMLLIDTSIRVFELLQPNFKWKEKLFERHMGMENFCEGFSATIPFCLERATRVQNASLPDTEVGVTNLRVVENKQQMRLYLSELVIWPLTIASALLHSLDDSLQQWTKQELAEIGRLTGDGDIQAVANAP